MKKQCGLFLFAVMIAVLLRAEVAGAASEKAVSSKASSPKSAVKKTAKKQPNIILCMADDMGWGDVGFNGGKIIQTPSLDAMAKNGMVFSRFYAGAPVCSPTRGSALTGRHPIRFGVRGANNGHMRSYEITLAETLKSAGYRTGHFGKWHLGTLTKTVKESNRGGPNNVAHFAPPWLNGFDVCFSTEAKVPTWDPMLKPNGAKKSWWDPVDPKEASPYGTSYWNEKGKQVTDNLKGCDSRVMMDRVVPFMQQATKDKKPFFAVVWFHAPHLPVVAGPKYTKPYAKYDKHAQHYYGCITALDEQMGRLRKELRTAGVANDTVLFFCSDNGPEGSSAAKAPGSAGHLRGRKRALYEGGIRVPGVVEWPGHVKAGRKTAMPACTSDYFRTVLQLAHCKPIPPRTLDGIDLNFLLNDQPLPPKKAGKKASPDRFQRPRPIAFQYGGAATLIDNRYKLVGSVANIKAGKPVALYDIVVDDKETNDIAKQHPQVVRKMRKLLIDWFASCEKDEKASRPKDWTPPKKKPRRGKKKTDHQG